MKRLKALTQIFQFWELLVRSVAKNNLAVFSCKQKSPVVAEAFQGLEVKFTFSYLIEIKLDESKTILVTSSIGGEGKTFVSMNLATVFAMSKIKRQ